MNRNIFQGIKRAAVERCQLAIAFIRDRRMLIFHNVKRTPPVSDWWAHEYSQNKLEYIAIMVAVVVLLAAVGMARAG